MAPHTQIEICLTSISLGTSGLYRTCEGIVNSSRSPSDVSLWDRLSLSSRRISLPKLMPRRNWLSGLCGAHRRKDNWQTAATIRDDKLSLQPHLRPQSILLAYLNSHTRFLILLPLILRHSPSIPVQKHPRRHHIGWPLDLTCSSLLSLLPHPPCSFPADIPYFVATTSAS